MVKTKTNTRMMSQSDAEKFVKKLLEDVFPNGKVELIDDFYTQNVVGHFNDGILGIHDIKDRVKAIKMYTQNCFFQVNQIVVFDQFIAFSCKQNWINKHDLSLYDALVFGIYRLSNNKICELWLIKDLANTSYQTINQNFSEYMKPFELNRKLKQEFLHKLTLLEQVHLNKQEHLTDVERECLYYYFNGFSAKECANCMSLSKRTVETYLAKIKEKFDCRTKHDLRKKLFTKK